MARRASILEKISSCKDVDDFNHEYWKILKHIREKSKFLKDMQYMEQRSYCDIPTEVQKNCCAVLPPLDSYLKITKTDALSHNLKLFEPGDIAYVRVTTIHEHGISAILIALGFSKSRDLEKLNLHVWLSESEIPLENKHENVLSGYSSGDLLCCEVNKFSNEDQELLVSLRRQNNAGVSLGKVEDSIPISSFKDNIISYEHMLRSSVSFANPNNVDYLMSKLGIPVKGNVSFTKTLFGKQYLKQDYAGSLRKKQSRNIAEKYVKEGVEKFKLNNFIEALQDYNHALDMDTENVNALVARGALYANRGSFTRSIHDFEVALKLQPSNKNAKKYLVEVIIERAKKIETQMDDVSQVKEVEKLYLQALQLDSECVEAKQALGKIKDKKLQLSKDTIGNHSPSESDKFAATADKLRKILRHETKHAQTVSKISAKQNKKDELESNASDSNSSSSSPSSSSSSSSESSPQEKKRPSSSRSLNKSQPKRKSSTREKPCSKYPSTDEKFYHKNIDLEDRKLHKRRHSDAPLNYHATIKSNSICSFKKRRKSEATNSELEKSRTSNVTRNKNDRNRIETKSNITTNLTKITKDNFHDILKEIKKFEHSNKLNH